MVERAEEHAAGVKSTRNAQPPTNRRVANARGAEAGREWAASWWVRLIYFTLGIRACGAVGCAGVCGRQRSTDGVEHAWKSASPCPPGTTRSG